MNNRRNFLKTCAAVPLLATAPLSFLPQTKTEFPDRWSCTSPRLPVFPLGFEPLDNELGGGLRCNQLAIFVVPKNNSQLLGLLRKNYLIDEYWISYQSQLKLLNVRFYPRNLRVIHLDNWWTFPQHGKEILPAIQQNPTLTPTIIVISGTETRRPFSKLCPDNLYKAADLVIHDIDHPFDGGAFAVKYTDRFLWVYYTIKNGELYHV